MSDKFQARGAIDRNSMVAMNELGDTILRIGADAEADTATSRATASAAEAVPDAEASGSADTATAAALRLYQRAMEIAQSLAAADLSDVVAQRDLVFSYYKLGNLQRQQEHFAEAVKHYERGLAVLKTFVAAQKVKAFTEEIADLERLIAECRKLQSVASDGNPEGSSPLAGGGAQRHPRSPKHVTRFDTLKGCQHCGLDESHETTSRCHCVFPAPRSPDALALAGTPVGVRNTWVAL